MPDSADTATKALVLASQEYFERMEGRLVVEVPAATSPLFLGPHPDDVALGCGGTVAKYAARGVAARMACLTDGRACVSGAEQRTQIVPVREQEERAAAHLLGAASPEMLAIPEDRFADPARADEWAARIAALIERLHPDAVFVPFWLELHPLHRHAAFLLARALGRLDLTTLPRAIFSYEVVSVVPPAVVVDISSVLDAKKEAVRCYRSQLAQRDYLKDLELIGAQRAPLAGSACRAAEAFFPLPARDYAARVLALGLEQPAVSGAGAQPMKPATGTA